MTAQQAIKILGGHATLYAIADRLLHARATHPEFARDMDGAVGVVVDEAAELDYAAREEGRARAHDEALDVIATAVRFVNREWLK